MKLPNLQELNTTQKLEAEFILFLMIIIIGSYILHNTESLSYFDAFYFSIVTLASIWYWDIVPHTVIWKLIVMFYALVWLPLFITMGYLMSSLLVQPIKKTRKRINHPGSIELHLEKAQLERKTRNK